MRAELEQKLTQATGNGVKVSLTKVAPTAKPALKSTVGRDADNVQAEKQKRRAEAKAHPIIQRAQDIFGVTAKEIRVR